MIRLYICPVIGTGVKNNPYRTKAATFGYNHASFIPSNTDGTPKFTWVLSVLFSNDWTAIEADIDCDDLLAGDLPTSINTRAEFRDFLKTRTVADVPLARRNAIIAVLDKYGVDRSDFTLQTSLWQVFKRVVRTLFQNEFDPEF